MRLPSTDRADPESDGMKYLALLLWMFLLPLHAAEVVRPGVLAGSWYPADPEALEHLVDRLLDQAGPTRLASAWPLRALILPHAGYRYSGATAAKGVALLRGRHYRRVLLLAPSHYGAFHGLSIAEASAYRTPLGEVPLDRQAVQQLRESPLVGYHPRAHEQEHSIEIELPLLQRALAPGWELIPILVGRLEGADYGQLAALLRPLADQQTLVIVSSDFTHYGKRFGYTPFTHDDNVAKSIRALDEGALERIRSVDLQGFLDYRQETGDTICGFRPIALLLALLPPSSQVEQLAYTSSGALTGDYRNSVSYAVLAITSSQPLSDGPDPGQGELSRQQLALLHQFALAGIRQAAQGNDEAQDALLERLQGQLTPALKRPAGAFVTLQEHDRLRGCIGYIQPRRPLYRAVLENGYNAARRDFRFTPLQPDELPGLEVEVSVLTPPRAIDSYRDFRVGEQGVILSKDGHRAVFLPEVALEQGWDRQQTLDQLARKAGLAEDAWREGARFQVFESQTYTAPYHDPVAGVLPDAGEKGEKP